MRRDVVRFTACHSKMGLVHISVGAIVVTLGVGTCSTNARFDDVNRRIDDVNARFEARFDDVQAEHPRVASTDRRSHQERGTSRLTY